MMDWLGKYPDDPTQKFLGENNTLSVLGQEVGHRWLAYLDSAITPAALRALLGRDDAPTGASSWTPTPRSWKATTSRTWAAGSSGRSTR